MRSERDKNLPFTRQHNPFTSPLPLLYLNPFPRLVSFHLLLLYSTSAASDHLEGQHQTKGIPLKNTLPGPLQDLDTPPPPQTSTPPTPTQSEFRSINVQGISLNLSRTAAFPPSLYGSSSSPSLLVPCTTPNLLHSQGPQSSNFGSISLQQICLTGPQLSVQRYLNCNHLHTAPT